MSRESLLWQTWAQTVRSNPEALAAVEADTGLELRREELDRLAREFHERSRGRLEGKRIALCCRNSASWLAAFLGVQRAGGCVLGLDAGTPTEKQEELARSVGAEWIISEDLGEIYLGGGKKSGPVSVVKLTSGTTGTPKEIYCRAEHLLADGRAAIKGMGIKAADRNLVLIPLSHSYALGNVVLPLILQGTTAVMARAFVPSQIPLWMAKYGVTVFPSVPVIYRLLNGLKPGTELKPLRLAISAGAALPAETARVFQERFGLDIHNFYGSSETGGICYDRTGRLARSGEGLGRPLPGVKVSISKSGTITVAGPAVAVPAKRFRLADRGCWIGKDVLQLLGRRDATANIGGKKVNPAEILKLLLAMPGVSDAWVGTARIKERDALIAAVETSTKEQVMEKELSKHLPVWKLPRLLRRMKTLPRNSRGKLDVAAIREMLLTAPGSTPRSTA